LCGFRVPKIRIRCRVPDSSTYDTIYVTTLLARQIDIHRDATKHPLVLERKARQENCLFFFKVSPHFIIRLKRSARFALYTPMRRLRMSGGRAHSCFRHPVLRTCREVRFAGRSKLVFCDFINDLEKYLSVLNSVD
jgi:hypothetical protein